MKEIIKKVGTFLRNWGDLITCGIFVVLFVIFPRESVFNPIGGVGIIASVVWITLKRYLDVKTISDFRKLLGK